MRDEPLPPSCPYSAVGAAEAANEAYTVLSMTRKHKGGHKHAGAGGASGGDPVEGEDRYQHQHHANPEADRLLVTLLAAAHACTVHKARQT